ncbi:hypothetical protein P3T23_009516 [Paraburkholderia sp. GAS448]
MGHRQLGHPGEGHETFDKRLVERLNTVKYEAVPILDYLGEVNANARNQ